MRPGRHPLAAVALSRAPRAMQHAEGRRLAALAASRLLGPGGGRPRVERSPGGRPRVSVNLSPSRIDVAISHGGACVAAAAVRGARVGIDVEPMAGMAPRHWRYFLTEREIRACIHRPRRALWAWTIKEAAFKALGDGRPLRFKQIEVRWRGGRAQVDVPGASGRHARGRAAPDVLLARYRGHAVAVVVVRP
jgi:phosphopantetheinyl transferase